MRLRTLQGMKDQPTEQFGIEVRGFGRHLFEVAGDFFDMLHRGRRNEGRKLAIPRRDEVRHLAKEMHISAARLFQSRVW